MKRSYGSSEKEKHDVDILYERQNKKKRHRDEIGGKKDTEKAENNLELYLENILENKCLYINENDEVRFIQEGIEKLVKEVMDLWLSMDIIADKLLLLLDSLLTSCKDIQCKVYYPRNLDSRFEKYARLKDDNLDLVKVGSFYEGTKNGFPDEFDIVCPFLCIKPGSYFSNISYIDKFFTGLVYSHSEKKLEFTSEDGKKILLSCGMQFNGPALTLKFVYTNGKEKERTINVDLVLAMWIQESFAHETLTNDGTLERCKKLKTFYENVRMTDMCLYTFRGSSLAHLEKEFLKNTFSREHVKVYRILKYLINGHGDGEKLKKELVFNTGSDIYSSYHIKLMMIYHHDVCEYSQLTDEVGPCVLQVLNEMKQYTRTNIPGYKGGGFRCFVLLPYLEQLIQKLTTMSTSNVVANCEEFKPESISGQFLHDRALESNVPRVCKEAQEICRMKEDDKLAKQVPLRLYIRYKKIHPQGFRLFPLLSHKLKTRKAE